jgi:predicted enzyme related to lactoylglutathione lyase
MGARSSEYFREDYETRVVHFEIYTDDPEAVQPFYQDVLAGRSTSSRVGRLNTGW